MTNSSIHGANLIASAQSSAGSSVYSVSSPASGEDLPGRFHDATRDEIDAAVRAATDAVEANRGIDSEARARLLEAAADEIELLGDALVARVMAETALPEGRVRGERGRTTSQLRMFAGMVREGSWVQARIDTADRARKPAPKPDLRRMLVPVGPVAVFGASNFPLAFSVAGGDTASALAAGCPVVVKAHPAHPGTSELVAEAINRAIAGTAFHPGTFSMLHGADPEVSQALVRHPDLQAVGFTGSHRAGRALFDAAASRPHPIPVFAEMGSVNPIFVLPGALRHRSSSLVDGLVGSVTLGSGQFCTNPGLVFGVDGADLSTFIENVAARLESESEYTMLHDGICSAYRAGIDRLRGLDGLEMVAAADAGPRRAGATVLATHAATFIKDQRVQEEVFGPSTIFIRCADVDEMVAAAQHIEGNLTASIHGMPDELVSVDPLRAVLSRRVGRIVYNGFPTGVEVCPSMHHGGPYPASTDVRSTSVGTAAVFRFARPICYQDAPEDVLPVELRDSNTRGVWRLVDGRVTLDDVA